MVRCVWVGSSGYGALCCVVLCLFTAFLLLDPCVWTVNA